MTAYMTRSALVYWGHNPSPETHSVVIEHHGPGGRRVVTWAEVMDARRKRQAEQLRRKRQAPEWRAYKLWVAYFDQDLMGGWHAFLEDHRGAGYRIWIDCDMTWLRPKLMSAFPLVLPLGDPWGRRWQAWEQWKVEFAAAFQRRRQDGHPLGVAYVWWNRRDSPMTAAR